MLFHQGAINTVLAIIASMVCFTTHKQVSKSSERRATLIMAQTKPTGEPKDKHVYTVADVSGMSIVGLSAVATGRTQQRTSRMSSREALFSDVESDVQVYYLIESETF